MQLVESFQHVIGPDLLTEHTNWLIVLYNPPITSCLRTLAGSVLVQSFVAPSVGDDNSTVLSEFIFNLRRKKTDFIAVISTASPNIPGGGG